MARRLRERQKVIQGRVPSSARKSKSTDPILLRPRRLSKLSPRSFSARDRALHALADMRHGASLFRAAHDNGVTTRTIKRYIGSALLQDRTGGRIRPTKSDRLIRYLQIPTPEIFFPRNSSKAVGSPRRYCFIAPRYRASSLASFD